MSTLKVNTIKDLNDQDKFGIQLGTVVTASGTSFDITGIPSWANRVSVLINGLSTNGTATYFVRLGTSGGIEATGYVGKGVLIDNTGNSGNSQTTGFVIGATGAAGVTQSGVMTLHRVTGNTWVATGMYNREDSTTAIAATAGIKTLSGTLDRIRLVTANGTDVFDAGTVNISWE